MNRKLAAWLVVLFTILCVAVAFWSRGGGGRESTPGIGKAVVWLDSPPANADITVRNVTKDAVIYRIKPWDSRDVAEKKELPIGAVHHYQSRITLVVFFDRGGKEVWRLLAPGKPYTFRYDAKKLLEVWQGSHSLSEAEDLAPFVATPIPVVEKMLEMAKVTKDDVVYDLGCGDGRMLIVAAEKYGARGVGIDIDPRRIAESKSNAKLARIGKRVKFILGDATKVDISKATVVTLYLLPESNELLRPKLERELKEGTRVVSHNYRIPGWKNREVASAAVLDILGKDHTVYLYRR